MKTDFLKGLGLTDEQISSIMAENGKDIEREKAKVEAVKADLEKAKADTDAQAAKLKELEATASDAEKFKTELTAMRLESEKREAEAKAKAEDDALTSKVLEVVGDKQFINEFTKSALIQEVKNAYKADPTKGVGVAFEALTKDKEGIFTPAQQFRPNMGGICEVQKSANPFAKETQNITEQMRLIKANPSEARKMAETAGVTLPE